MSLHASERVEKRAKAETMANTVRGLVAKPGQFKVWRGKRPGYDKVSHIVITGAVHRAIVSASFRTVITVIPQVPT